MTSAELQAQYEAYSPLISDFMTTGNESDYKLQMQKAADYNKPITDAMAQNQGALGQVLDRYNSNVDPMLQGLDMDQRSRLRSYDAHQFNVRGGELGAYKAAREGTLADTVTTWKDAWNTKYQSMKEQQAAKQQAWQMAFDQEKEATRQKEAAAQLQQQMAIARMSASSSGSSASDKSQNGYWDDMRSMAKELAKNGGGQYRREQIGNFLIGKYGNKMSDGGGDIWTPGSSNKGSVWDDIYATLDNGWENRYK